MNKLLLCIFFLAALLTRAGDNDGNAISSVPPQRILSTAAAATAIILDLNAGERLAAIDVHGRVVPGTNRIPVIGYAGRFSREAVLTARIDSAILWDYQTECAAMLEKLDIPVLRLPAIRLSTYRDTVRRIAEHLRIPAARANALADRQPKLPDRPLPENAPAVYFELYAPEKTVGENSYIHELLTAAGARNIAAAMPVSGKFSREQLLLAAPEVIFFIEGFGSAEEIAARPGYEAIPAVRNRRIHAVPRRYTVAGLDATGAVQYLKRHIFSEAF